MARLDRLGGAKELAQIGAAIGREFSHELLACGGVQARGEAGNAARQTHSRGIAVPPGRAARRDLFVQARSRARCGLWPAAARAETPPSRSDRRDPREQVQRDRREQARSCWRVTGPRRANIERAAALWGKAGRRSAQRSALVEATEQLRRALDMIATLPSTPALRRDEIKLQVELITPLLHVRGYAAPETRAAVERARASDRTGARHSESSQKIRCCCFPFFTACGSRTLSPSTAT